MLLWPKLSLLVDIKVDGDMNISEVKEKVKISDYANSGCYAFRSHLELMEGITEIIDKDIRMKNEFYTSTVIDQMLKKQKPFRCILVPNKNFYSLGTPDQVDQFQTTWLLDLDGT